MAPGSYLGDRGLGEQHPQRVSAGERGRWVIGPERPNGAGRCAERPTGGVPVRLRPVPPQLGDHQHRFQGHRSTTRQGVCPPTLPGPPDRAGPLLAWEFGTCSGRGRRGRHAGR